MADIFVFTTCATICIHATSCLVLLPDSSYIKDVAATEQRPIMNTAAKPIATAITFFCLLIVCTETKQRG